MKKRNINTPKRQLNKYQYMYQYFNVCVFTSCYRCRLYKIQHYYLNALKQTIWKLYFYNISHQLTWKEIRFHHMECYYPPGSATALLWHVNRCRCLVQMWCWLTEIPSVTSTCPWRQIRYRDLPDVSKQYRKRTFGEKSNTFCTSIIWIVGTVYEHK